MYFIAPVTKWLTQKDGTTRVHALDKTGVHNYLLNTDRIYKLSSTDVSISTVLSCDSTTIFCDENHITCDTVTVGVRGNCSFFYDERPLEKKESFSYIEANVSTDYVKSISNIQFSSKFITIPVYKNNIYGKPLTNLTLQSDCIIYAHAHSDSAINASWVLYGIHDFKKVRVLSSLSMADIIGLCAETAGFTTTTATTTLYPEFDDPSFDSNRRDGLSLIDIINGNNATILTPVYLEYTNLYSGGSSHERLFNGISHTFYIKMRQMSDMGAVTYYFPFLGGIGLTTYRGFGLIIVNGDLYSYFADGTTHQLQTLQISGVDTILKGAGWVELFVQVDVINKTAICNIIKISDGTTVGTNASGSILTWDSSDVDNNMSLRFQTQGFAYADLKKFIGLKTIGQCRDSSYITDIEFYYPTISDGTDVSGYGNHLWAGVGTVASSTNNDYYCNISTYLLDYGYTLYRRGDKPDIYIPRTVSGDEVIRTITGYIKTETHGGSLTHHNFAKCYINIPVVTWNKSLVTIFEDKIRNSVYYDAANPNRWHISEFDFGYMYNNSKVNYNGLNFFKINDTYGIGTRQYLVHIFSYINNKTGADFDLIVAYINAFKIGSVYYTDSMLYGARNDATDDAVTTMAITKCCEIGGNIGFRDGTYNIINFSTNTSIILRGKTNFIGTSKTGTIFQGVYSTTMLMISGVIDDDTLDAYLENFTVIGTGGWHEPYDIDPQNSAIYFSATTGHQYQSVIIKNILAYNWDGIGIQIQHSLYAMIDSCHVQNSNFTAYNLVDNIDGTIQNCTSDFARMFIECLGSMNPASVLNVFDCSATNIWQYGIRFYNGNLLNVDGASFSFTHLFGDPFTYLDSRGIYLDTYGQTLHITKAKIKDVTVDFCYTVIRCETLVGAGELIDEIEIENLITTNSDYDLAIWANVFPFDWDTLIWLPLTSHNTAVGIITIDGVLQ